MRVRAFIASLGLTAAFLAGGLAPPARAQGIDFADQQNSPVEIYADKGLELAQDAKTLIARGNARAVRGRVTVTADVLTAYYRDKKPGAAGANAKPEVAPIAATPAKAEQALGDPGGNSEVWRLEAEGHVVIFTDTQRAYGDHAEYNIDDAVVVLTGKNLRIVTPSEEITARDSLEYWDRRQQAVARGKAVAIRGDRRIQADVLVADYGQDKQKRQVLKHATGFDNVTISTANEIVTGKRADYDPLAGIATVTGAVHLTRGENQLEGEYAVVNLNTGISRLFPTAPGGAPGTDSRVKGLLVPERKNGANAPAGNGAEQPASKP